MKLNINLNRRMTLPCNVLQREQLQAHQDQINNQSKLPFSFLTETFFLFFSKPSGVNECLSLINEKAVTGVAKVERAKHIL